MVALIDGPAYLASSPLAAHEVATRYKLPILTIVIAPESMRFDEIAAAAGAIALRVESPRELAPAIRRALAAVRERRQQALLNIVCERSA